MPSIKLTCLYRKKEDKLQLKLKHTNPHFQMHKCPSFFQIIESEAKSFCERQLQIAIQLYKSNFLQKTVPKIFTYASLQAISLSHHSNVDKLYIHIFCWMVSSFSVLELKRVWYLLYRLKATAEQKILSLNLNRHYCAAYHGSYLTIDSNRVVSFGRSETCRIFLLFILIPK